jgi:prepilin-type N-terminal cleavage/methylation domain-containing protein
MNTTKIGKGFTLIELLVVIAIVALLLAILGPSLAKTREQVEDTICKSNLKQWALVFHLYAGDNEESFPQSVEGNGINTLNAYHLGALLPYYEDLDLRDCPSTEALDRRPSTGNIGGTFIKWGPFPESINGRQWFDTYAAGAYGFNDYVADPPADRSSFWGISSSNAVRNTFEPSAYLIPMVSDSVWCEEVPKMQDNAPSDTEHEMDVYDAGWNTNALKYVCIDRHKGGINAAFVDMDVRHVGVKELWLLKWHANWRKSDPPNAWPSWTDIHKDYDW